MRPRSSGSSGVEEARGALGQRLRELRRQAHLNGKELAESLSWQPSKVSKIENGKQTPTNDDIKAWTRATNAEPETEALLASLHTLEVQHAEWQRVLKAGMVGHQLELSEQDARTKLYRSFEPAVVPGLLQTAEYARALFSRAVTVHRVPNDVSDAVAKRMLRQEMLYRADKAFHFVITEGTLRNRVCSVDILLGQLDRLVSLTSLRNVRLGVIGYETQYVVDPRHGFMLYNSELVRVETYSAELNLRQPHEIHLYTSTFEKLAAVASYRGAARAIINRAIHDLTPDQPEDG
ncbi:helix-turn-helix domain-containing protein [Streptomyces hainanensis]|uniref:XRE family transcriptional regulator n=1 Tax=Streptomyces hainanensis TaxID=402648 RepID=A0A4R4TXG2_9ACTN|nr:helix-turn-helix transcriptional regulator [Streptomyces hainanensis]TDC79963.1 XRE family transcriptional regulator [Streptomyces hainanensis]